MLSTERPLPISGMWLVLALAAFAAATCPPEEDVYPCFCSDDTLLTSVNCEHMHSLDKLGAILKNTEGLNVSYGFWNSRLGSLPSQLFQGQRATSLHFENCKIDSFGDRPFSGLEDTLSNVFVYGSVDKRRKDLETFPLGHLRRLEYLSFQANDIQRLGNDWFRNGPASLRQLMLEANDIQELGDRAFESLVNLEQVWMGDNSFKTVARSMFPQPARKLMLLEISFNGIESLPGNFFEDMPELKVVNLSGNKLQQIPESIWGKVWDNLEEVYLERNPGFSCDESLKWIYQRKSLPKIFSGTCRGGNLNGKNLKDLKLADFD